MDIANNREDVLTDEVDEWCRGTFVGQKYGPFNDIPAVWDQYFGTKGYKALAAGIAGALPSTFFSVWSQKIAALTATSTSLAATPTFSLV